MYRANFSRPILVAAEVLAHRLAERLHPASRALGRAQVRLGRALFNDSDAIVAFVGDALVAVARRVVNVREVREGRLRIAHPWRARPPLVSSGRRARAPLVASTRL